MERVDRAVGRSGPAGGDQGLAGDVAAEDALAPLVRLASPEQVLLDRLEVEELEQGVEGGGHGSSRRARVG
jgi:hypothetical protein